MRKYLFLGMALMLLISSSIGFAIPQLISLQGRLTDSSDNPLSGSYIFNFTIFDAETLGNSIWSETQTLTTDTGIFSALLGSVTPLNIPFDKDYWLSINVSNQVLSPRVRITSSGYTYTTKYARDYVSKSGDTMTGSLDVEINKVFNMPSNNYYGIGTSAASSSANANITGVYGNVTTIAGQTGFGVYGKATGTGKNYAGTFDGNTTIWGDLNVSGMTNLLGDLLVGGDLTVSGMINANLGNADTVDYFHASATPENEPITNKGKLLAVDENQGFKFNGTLKKKSHILFENNQDKEGGIVWKSSSAYLSRITDQAGNMYFLTDDNFYFNQINTADGNKTATNWFKIESGNASIDSGTLFVDASHNRVGIGTTSPITQLDLRGGYATNIRIEHYTNLGRTYSAHATVLGNNVMAYDGTTSKMVNINTHATYAGSAIWMQGNDGITFHTKSGSASAGADYNSPRMKITADGNIGIGTTGPTNKLSVNGNADISGDLTVSSGNIKLGSYYIARKCLKARTVGSGTETKTLTGAKDLCQNEYGCWISLKVSGYSDTARFGQLASQWDGVWSTRGWIVSDGATWKTTGDFDDATATTIISYGSCYLKDSTTTADFILQDYNTDDACFVLICEG